MGSSTQQTSMSGAGQSLQVPKADVLENRFACVPPLDICLKREGPYTMHSQENEDALQQQCHQEKGQELGEEVK